MRQFFAARSVNLLKLIFIFMLTFMERDGCDIHHSVALLLAITKMSSSNGDTPCNIPQPPAAPQEYGSGTPAPTGS